MLLKATCFVLKAVFVVLFGLVDPNSRKVIRPERYRHDERD
jgi:hypothetical protein